MDLGLGGKRAVVTGGSAGIGAAIVEALLGEGCSVHFCGRSAERIARFETRLAGRREGGAGDARGAVVDVTDRAALSGWLDRIGGFEIAIANVSALAGDWESSIATDLHGTVGMLEEVAPRIADGGAITYVGSKAASFATPAVPAYGAIKAAMAHYTKSLAAQLAQRGVRVNTVSPGDTFVEGGFWDKIRRSAPEAYDAAVAGNPMGRLARPEEIARVVAFMSSPAASFVSGANWYADGGSTEQVRL